MHLANHDETATQRERPSALRLAQIQADNPYVALGLAVSHLMAKPAFSNLRFGDWSRVLVGQINRKHYDFAIDEQKQVQGFVGWALATKDNAEAWLAGRRALSYEDSRDGDCVIINVWAASSPRPGACCATQCVGSAWASRRSISSATTRTAPRVPSA